MIQCLAVQLILIILIKYMTTDLFTLIRKASIIVLILTTALFSLMAVLSIWEVVEGDVFEKSMMSLFTILISSGLVGISALIGEGKGSALFSSKTSTGEQQMSAGRIIFAIAGLFVIFYIFSEIFW
jgi:hypothetical protein